MHCTSNQDAADKGTIQRVVRFDRWSGHNDVCSELLENHCSCLRSTETLGLRVRAGAMKSSLPTSTFSSDRREKNSDRMGVKRGPNIFLRHSVLL